MGTVRTPAPRGVAKGGEGGGPPLGALLWVRHCGIYRRL